MKKKFLHIGLSATGYPYNGLQRAFVKHFDYEEINTATKNLNETIITTANKFNPDIIFIQIQTPGFIHERTVMELKKNGAFVVNFTGDVRTPIPKWYYDLGKHIDLTLFSNRTDVEEMKRNGYRAEFLEYAIDETIYTPEGASIPTRDIVFMGNHYGNDYFPLSMERNRMVDYMKNTFGNKFGVYGNGWQGANGNYNGSQPQEAAAYRGCKIAINISHFEYKDYSSDRLLRILGSGAFCLCRWFPNVEDRFGDGYHLRVWKTFDELRDLCIYYLANDEKRKRIAANGQRYCHDNFTFDHFAKNILKLSNA